MEFGCQVHPRGAFVWKASRRIDKFVTAFDSENMVGQMACHRRLFACGSHRKVALFVTCSFGLVAECRLQHPCYLVMVMMIEDIE